MIPAQKVRTTIHQQLRKRYDQLWLRAFARIRAGKIDLDPVLESQRPDRRRGWTLIARPSATVKESVTLFLRDLRRFEPGQYYYAASEFHVTVLSLFTATADFEPFAGRKERYIEAVDAALKRATPIRIVFDGITASPGTVMIQGFFETNELHELRDGLRHQLRLRGLDKGVDERYRLQTAHMTIVRFRAPLRHTERFAKALEQARRRPFGVTTMRSFSLVQNDWYMSQRATVVLKRYRFYLRSFTS
jgi:2'-5' RNA ligase